jgi:hypothetical protein
MKHTYLVGLALLLAGCQTAAPAPPVTPSPGTPPFTPIEEKIIDIRDAAEKACDFVPAVAFLKDMFAQQNNVLNSVQEYVNAICKVVVAPQPRAAARTGFRILPGTVNGVRVSGTFVK